MSLPPVRPGVQPDIKPPFPGASSAGESAPEEPFEALLAALLQAERAVRSDPESLPQPEAAPREQAKIFNEDGFFPGAVPGDEAVPAGQDPVASQGAAALPPRAAASTLADPVLSAGGPVPDPLAALSPRIGFAGGLPPRAPRPVELDVGPMRAVRPLPAGRDVKTMATASEPSADLTPAADEVEAAAGRRAAPPPSADRDGGTMQARLALQAAGAEASIVARVQALTREERSRLRLEVAALLARYGLTSGEIRLNGESEPIASFMRESE